jgi:UDP-N-acetylglucosamine 2-epimerase (non-hydrolysing)
MKIVTVFGTRPEVIKMAPVIKEIDKLGHEHVVIDSGQHWSHNMSQVFYGNMGLRMPNYNLAAQRLGPPEQVSAIIGKSVEILRGADLCIVLGDTNTTLAGALAANKLNIPVAHVEAGLRSGDKRMPEEINRTLVDHMSTLLFAPSAGAVRNLHREGIWQGVHNVGNSITDALLYALPKLSLTQIPPEVVYAVVTIHRVENLTRERLSDIAEALRKLQGRMNIIFPAHPRTRKSVVEWGIDMPGMCEPLSYTEMLLLLQDAAVVITDSGGLQEEACFLKVPCVTLRDTTERPETLEIGANRLAGTHPDVIERVVEDQLRSKRDWVYPYGDGTTAKQIAKIVEEFL